MAIQYRCKAPMGKVDSLQGNQAMYRSTSRARAAGLQGVGELKVKGKSCCRNTPGLEVLGV